MRKSLYLLLLFNLLCCAQKDSISPVHEQKAMARKNVWVFLMAGQSNMAGRGDVEPIDTIPNHRVLTINRSNELIVAKEPIHFYEPESAGLDCGLSFGTSLARSIPDSVSILILPTAVGGSSINQWLGDSLHRGVKLFTNLSEKIQIAKKYGDLKAVLWHQGESDAKNAHGYGERLKLLIQKIRAVSDNDLPILVGELGSFSKDNQQWRFVNEQIKQLNDPKCLVVSTDDLTDKGDKIHFDSKSQRLLGERFARAYLSLAEKMF